MCRKLCKACAPNALIMINSEHVLAVCGRERRWATLNKETPGRRRCCGANGMAHTVSAVDCAAVSACGLGLPRELFNYICCPHAYQLYDFLICASIQIAVGVWVVVRTSRTENETERQPAPICGALTVAIFNRPRRAPPHVDGRQTVRHIRTVCVCACAQSASKIYYIAVYRCAGCR